MRLTLGVHQRVSGPAIDADRVMVNFAVTDIHAVAQELRAAGVTFSREPTQESWGGWIATFADPDGNTLQLLQPVG